MHRRHEFGIGTGIAIGLVSVRGVTVKKVEPSCDDTTVTVKKLSRHFTTTASGRLAKNYGQPYDTRTTVL